MTMLRAALALTRRDDMREETPAPDNALADNRFLRGDTVSEYVNRHAHYALTDETVEFGYSFRVE